MKRTLFIIVSGVITILSSALLLSWEPSGKPAQSGNIYTGNVKPLITSTITYGTNDVYRGFITYAARQGNILHGPTYDLDGKIIKSGDILVSLAKDYNESLLAQAKAQGQIAKINLACMKAEYERYRKLRKNLVVSSEQYEIWINNYCQALGKLSHDQQAIETCKIELDLCDYHAEYDCIVEKTLMPFGLCAGESPVQVISQLDPMGINIKMDRETARKITPQTPVTVYPMASGKPVGIMPYSTILSDDGIILRVRNFAVPPKNLVDGKKIPLVKCRMVICLYTSGDHKPIGVPEKAVAKDKQGYFVWKALGQKSNQPGKGIDNIFRVKKEYIKLGKISRYCGNFIYYDEVIPENDNLAVNDLLIVNPPIDLKENDKVYYYKEIYLFMPGDQVKVKIDI
jgi:hypothetical protein